MKREELPSDLQRLWDAFATRLQATEIDASPVEGTPRYRFAVVSPLFEGVSAMERQDRAWKIVDEVLGREGVLTLTLVFTYAPSDAMAAVLDW